MNTTELTDALMSLSMMDDYEKQEYGRAAATMLRQQQAAYDELKRLCQKVHLMLEESEAEIEALKADKALHDEAYLSQMKEIEALKIKLAEAIDAETDEEINVVAILQDAEIVPVGHEIWKTGEEFNKYKRIVLATAKALRKAIEK